LKTVIANPSPRHCEGAAWSNLSAIGK